MKLKMYDNVKLNIELKDLAERGVHKGCTGIILEIKADDCFVRFRNRKNIGDYACVNINGKYLEFYRHEQEENIPNWERFKNSNKIKQINMTIFFSFLFQKQKLKIFLAKGIEFFLFYKFKRIYQF